MLSLEYGNEQPSRLAATQRKTKTRLEAERGELLDADEVFAELYEMIEGCRSSRPVTE